MKGIGGHQSPVNETDVWLTPPEIIAALTQYGGGRAPGHGEFALDPCAAPEPRAWKTACVHYALPQDGLTLPWWGRVFLNPPYGSASIVGPWMRKLADHNHGTALIFARTETEVFYETVWNKASAILFLKGRLHFYRPDGTRAPGNAGAPSCLVAYGETDAAALAASGLPGAFVTEWSV